MLAECGREDTDATSAKKIIATKVLDECFQSTNDDRFSRAMAILMED